MWQPRSADEFRNLTALAQAAVGFDTTRGDVLTVEDLAFDDNRSAAGLRCPSRCWRRAESSPVLIKYVALLVGVAGGGGLRRAARAQDMPQSARGRVGK